MDDFPEESSTYVKVFDDQHLESRWDQKIRKESLQNVKDMKNIQVGLVLTENKNYLVMGNFIINDCTWYVKP